MANQTRFSPLNPFRMLPDAETLPARYHSRNFDQTFQAYTLAPGEERSVYLKPVERTDPFRFQFSTTAFSIAMGGSTKLTIVDCNGKTVLTVNDPVLASIPGNAAEDGTPMVTYQYAMPSYAGIATDGQYYLVLSVTYASDNVQKFVSNPFLLQDFHPDTLFVEYRNRTNWLDTYFEQINTLFGTRVEGIVTNFQPATNTTSFEDQNQKLVQLRSTPFRQWTLKVGGNGNGISDSELDYLNNVFTCSAIYIDGKQFLKSDGANWDKVTEELTPLFGASIQLREGEPNKVGNFTDGRVKLWTIPASYPYAVGQVYISSQGDLARLFTGTRVINNVTQENAFLVELETQLTSGSIAKSGGVVYYNNGIGIQYTQGGATLLPYLFAINVNVPANFSTGPIVTGIQYLIDWGDNTTPNYYGSASGGPQLPVTAIRTHSYATDGNYTIRLFHNEYQITEVKYNSSVVTSISGRLPSALTKLDLAFTAIQAFDFGILSPTVNFLKLLSLANTPDLVTFSNVPPGLLFKALKDWQFQNSRLTKVQATNLLNSAFATAINYSLSGGYFNIRTQTPQITLDPSAQLNAQNLSSGFNWQVLY